MKGCDDMLFFGGKYKKECERLTEELSNAKSECQRLTDELSNANSELESLRSRLSNAKDKFKELSDVLSDYQNKLWAKDSLLQEKDRELSKKDKELSEKDKLIQRLENMIPPKEDIPTEIPSGRPYLFIDLETTGVNKQSCEIIEIGALRYLNGQISDRFQTYVRPVGLIPKEASEINGITNDMVKDSPDLRIALKSFLDFLSPEDVISGYNIASFDIPILKRDLRSELHFELSNIYFDVMNMVSKSFISVPNKKLSTVAEYFGISSENAHHAVDDCEITIHCYEKLLETVDPVFYSCVEINTPKMCRPTEEDPDTSEYRMNVIRQECPGFSINGKSICLSGSFNYGSKTDVENVIVENGGVVKSTVSKRTDYLIVGSIGSDRWKHGQYGTKVVQACSLIESGSKIKIVSERVLADYLSKL